MTESLSRLGRDLITAWVTDGTTPGRTIEASGPRLVEALGLPSDALDYDRFLHREGRPDWTVERIAFPDYFDGTFTFYRPVTWSGIVQSDSRAQLSDGTGIRQSIFLVTMSRWRDTLDGFFAASDIEGLFFRTLHRRYVKWLIITGGGSGPWWVWSVHGAGDWVTVAKGDATTPELLEQQITAMVNSNPWWGWIERAWKQDRAGQEQPPGQ